MARRKFSPFSLSFLDVMCCGFGAVVLMVLIINAGTAERSRKRTHDLRSETERLAEEVLDTRKRLARARNSLEEAERERVLTEGLSRALITVTREAEREVAELESDTLAKAEHINKLAADLRSLEEEAKRLEAASHGRDETGEKIRSFRGDGDRQYVTGLQVGGDRVFILVDASASMLDETIVNVIRRRNLPDDEKRRSVKWQRAVATVDWLTTQLSATARFQIHTFNIASTPLIKGTDGEWLLVSAPDKLEEAVKRLRKVVPRGGTSLHHAFEAAAAMQPPPSNIFLLVDGLPTQGESRSRRPSVSADQRLRHFDRALGKLPDGVPVNVLLFPMEGDPEAAGAYWHLAQMTRGSLMSPSVDWP